MIVAEEMGAPLFVWASNQHSGVSGHLSSLTEGEVLFLDSHRMSSAEEMLYMAMGSGRHCRRKERGDFDSTWLPPFTIVGATTRAGLLPGPLRDLRFYGAS